MNSQELLQAGVGLFKDAAFPQPNKTLGGPGGGGIGGAGLKALNPAGPKPLAGGVGGLKPPTRPPMKPPQLMANKGFQDMPKTPAMAGAMGGAGMASSIAGPANPNATANYAFGGPSTSAVATGAAPPPAIPPAAPATPQAPTPAQQPLSPADGGAADPAYSPNPDYQPPNPRGPGFEAEIARMDGMNAPPTPVNPRGPDFEAAVADMNARMPESGPGPNPRGPDFEAEIARMDGMNAPPEPGNPRGPDFEAEIARMDGMNAPAQADSMATGSMASPPPDSMDLPDATARFEATGGGGAMPAPPERTGRFAEQLKYYDSLNAGEVGGKSSRGSIIGKDQKANANDMINYYTRLQGTGDRIANKARADLQGGREVSNPKQNYLARRDEFETGLDPNAFNADMSTQSANVLHSGLQQQLDEARRGIA
jgi:hypothetical protein